MFEPDVSPELPSSTWRGMLALLGRLPQGAMSRGFGRIADLPIPRPLRRPVLGTFAAAVGANLSEAEHPLEHYRTLNEFFVRRLRPGMRRWPKGPDVLGSPVDGIVGQLGQVRDGRILQAKGRSYSVESLLQREDAGVRYAGGSYLTIYLSPRHYHRIHAPCSGVIPEAEHLPGALLPVNAAAVMHMPELFARNERLVTYIESAWGRVAVVAVGAYNVGRISAAFDPQWRGRGAAQGEEEAPRSATNRPGEEGEVHQYDPAVSVTIGDEIMTFHLGSTVVLLLERAAPPLTPELAPGRPVSLGDPIARR